VLLGPDGLLQGLHPGSIVVDCSTSIPSSTMRMARAVEDAGARFLEAPMTRTPKEAAQGRLNLLVGGEAEVLERVRPILSCLAEHITHVGPTGTGHGMKLLHNYVSLGMVTLLAEAAACATRSGMAPEVFVDVLARGGGGGIALERLKPYLLSGDPGGLRFTLANACKDLGYYQQMAADTHTARAVAAAVLATLQSALDRSPVGTLVPELAGLLGREPG
jgi:3-hydroxyisobutyrate dehydrogenase-like beta-hydroxyacid dehydrogenase